MFSVQKQEESSMSQLAKPQSPKSPKSKPSKTPQASNDSLKNAQGLWLDLLRSNKYKQAKGFLKSKEGYCALGLACLAFNQFHNRTERITGHWPEEEVTSWLGLKDSMVFVVQELNDQGTALSYIADIIEETPLLFFAPAK
jgi:hypothetical protein